MSKEEITEVLEEIGMDPSDEAVGEAMADIEQDTKKVPEEAETQAETGTRKNRVLDYCIIASGSSGNAVRIENIMFDCGIPFSRMKEELYKCDTLLITHAHSDHIVPATYEAIRQSFPRIKVCANADVAYRYEVDQVIGTAEFKLKKGRTVIPFDCVHDVPCTGYILKMKDMNILYATDTGEIEPPDGLKYDWVFLESNFDDRKLKALSKQYRKGRYNPYESMYRHLSTQKCKEFYYVNRYDRDCPLVELHKSSRFY